MLINYSNFSDTSALKLNGGVSQSAGALQLTPDAIVQMGSAFWKTPILLNSSSSFSTYFQLQIRGAQGTNGADGMTFMLQNSSRGVDAVGGWAGQLGYGAGQGNAAIENSLAIKSIVGDWSMFGLTITA